MKKDSLIIKITLYLFFFIFTISFWKFEYNTIIRYTSLLIIQFFLLALNIKNNNFKYNKKTFVVLSILFITMLFSLLINFSYSSLEKTLGMIDLFIFTYFLLTVFLNKHKLSEFDFLKILSNTFFIVLFISFVLFYNDAMFYGNNRQGLTNYRHLFNFEHASNVGIIAFIDFTITFYVINKNKEISNHYSLKNRIIDFFKLLLPISMMYLADIRAAIISTLLFLAFFYIEKIENKKIKFSSKFLVISILIIMSMYFLSYSDFDFNKMDTWLSGRLSLTKESFLDIVENSNILFGNGAFRNNDLEILNKIQVDNSYVDILYQYGIIVFIIYVVLIIYLFNQIYRKSRKIGNKYNAFIKSYFISVLIYSLAEKNLFIISSPLAIITFCLVFWYISKNDTEMI